MRTLTTHVRRVAVYRAMITVPFSIPQSHFTDTLTTGLDCQLTLALPVVYDRS